MKDKEQDKEEFYKKIQQEQMLIDIDEFAHKMLEEKRRIFQEVIKD